MTDTQSPTAIVWMQPEPARNLELLKWNSEDVSVLSKWIECERTLARISTLGDNWDGFNAPVPDQTVLARASFFMRLLRERDIATPPIAVVLSPSGSVALEWVRGNGLLRAEVSDSDEVEWMRAIPGQPTSFSTESLIPECEAMEGQGWGPARADFDVSVTALSADVIGGQKWRPAPAPAGDLAYASAL